MSLPPSSVNFGYIPRNYFCSWAIPLDVQVFYDIIVTRNYTSYQLEQIEIEILDDDGDSVFMYDSNLYPAQDSDWTSFRVMGSNGLKIWARQLYTISNVTFEILLEDEYIDVDYVLSFISFGIFICVVICICACCVYIIRSC